MEAALDEARAARAAGEVPVGAVVVLDGRVLARAGNRTRRDADPTAHAELLAVREAARALGYERLLGATVYSTVEPCFMCAGALAHARVARVVFGVRDPKFGGCASLGSVLSDPRLNHRAEIVEGIGADAARALLREFFEDRRAQARAE
jgi:tRNA(Arg) A34 adenosine deaminase TadA